METDYTKIKLNPLFEPIKKLFEFYLLGIGFIGMPEFQKSFMNIHPGITPLLNEYNKEVNLRVEGTKIRSETKLYLVYIGRFMAIGIFDFLQFSKYNKDLSNTDIYRFVKHIRNGAAHDNKFYFEGRDPINKPAVWQDKRIELTLKGSPVIPDFITPTELIFLMSDISKMIETNNYKSNS